jgi:SEC-C motif-containing protein
MARMSSKNRKSSAACPCGGPRPYAECCGPLHAGTAQASTAEQLMRSRFSAFAKKDEAYILRSWAEETRPREVAFDPTLHWERLEILRTTDGGPFHTIGTVEFRAHYSDGGKAGSLHEASVFHRDPSGAWVYVVGQVQD